MSTGGAISGGLSGAASGAAVGSVVPGIGTAAGAVIGGGLGAFGGSKSSDDAPAAPDPMQVSRQAIQAQIQGLPDIISAQQQYGPQFTQAELDLLREFAPQFLTEQVELEREFAPQIAEITREQQEILAPERVAAQNLLREFFETPQGLSDTERALIQEQSRSAQSARGLAETGFGAVEEVRALADLRNQIRQQQLTLAANSAGQVPVSGGFTTSVPNVSPGRLVQNVTPGNIFGLAGQNIAASSATADRRSDILSEIIGGGFSLVGKGNTSTGGTFKGNLGGMNVGQAAAASGNLLNYFG